MKRYLKKDLFNYEKITNSEELALSRVGLKLYNKMFKNYTKKQWGSDSKRLDPLVMARIPIRYDNEERYFLDKYQQQPIGGFTKLFETMLSNKLIKVSLNTNFFQFRKNNSLIVFD